MQTDSTGSQDDVFSSDFEDCSQEIYRELEKKRNSKNETPDTLSLLDRRHMLAVLVFLKHNRPAIKSDIYANISRNVNMVAKLETLQKMGLIGMYNTFESNTTYIILTDKGERVANMIEEMVEEIEKKEEVEPISIYTYWKEKNMQE